MSGNHNPLQRAPAENSNSANDPLVSLHSIEKEDVLSSAGAAAPGLAVTGQSQLNQVMEGAIASVTGEHDRAGSESADGDNEDDEDGSDGDEDEEDEDEGDLDEIGDIKACYLRTHLAIDRNCRSGKKDELLDALDSCASAHAGSYASWKQYGAAPGSNPCLDIDGVGLLGLPLSAAEAERLKAVCHRAPFGKGGRTVFDATVRDTWELDPQHIRFRNPMWDAWVQATLKDVCEAIGVASQTLPRCELYKLLLYEAGSHFLSHQDTEKAPNMFATMVITLPSEYEGGEVNVKHGTQTKAFDPAATNLLMTSVLAWYTDIFHEVRPIKSGFRLALTYNLIHTGSSSPPLPPQFGPVSHLESVLRAWDRREEHGDDVPEKLAYILNHQYSRSGISFSHLKGADAHLVSALNDVCERAGFCVALGHMELHESGSAEDNGYGGYSRRRREYWDDSDDDEAEDVTMGEVGDRNCTVELISGPNGQLAGRQESFDLETELLQGDDYFDGLEPDDKDYEGYQGNYAGSVDQYYHRTVLLIWPRSRNGEMIARLGGVEGAIDQLKACSSSTPTQTDLDSIEVALASKTVEAGRILTDLALRWEDEALWARAIARTGCDRDVQLLGQDRLLQAYKAFGFCEQLQRVFDTLFSSTPGIRARLDFLAAFESHELGMVETKAKITDSWASDKRIRILRTLRSPTPDDIEPMISTFSRFTNDTSVLLDVCLPQLRALNLGAQWWIHFISRLYNLLARMPTFNGWQQAILAVVNPIFEQALLQARNNRARFDLLNAVDSLGPSEDVFKPWAAVKRPWVVANLIAPSIEEFPLVIQLIRDDGGFLTSVLLPKLKSLPFSLSLWQTAFTQLRLVAQTESDVLPLDWQVHCAEALVVPLAREFEGQHSNYARLSLIHTLLTSTEDLPQVQEILQARKRIVLDNLIRLSTVDVPLLVSAIRADSAFGLTNFIRQLKKLRPALDFWKALISSVKQSTDIFLNSGWQAHQFDNFLTLIVTEAIVSTPITPAVKDPAPPRTAYYHPVLTVPQTSEVINVVKNLLLLCIQCDRLEIANLAFRKLFSSCKSKDAIIWTISPLIGTVASVLRETQVSADTAPFNDFFREAIRAYLVSVLGPRPTGAAQSEWKGAKIECRIRCADCELVDRLLASPDRQVIFRAAERRRNHVQSQIPFGCGLTLDTIRQGSPYGLQITKSDAYMASAMWQKNSTKGRELLSTIGDATMLNRLFVSPMALTQVLQCLEGAISPTTLRNSVAPHSTQPTAQSGSSTRLPMTTTSMTTSTHNATATSSTKSNVPRKRKATNIGPKDVIELSD